VQGTKKKEKEKIKMEKEQRWKKSRGEMITTGRKQSPKGANTTQKGEN